METERRIFIVAYENVLENEEYKDYLKKIHRLGNAILCRLGDKNELFKEYENLVNLSEAIFAETVYSTGFKDGQKKNAPVP